MLVSMASVAGWLIRHKNYFPSPQIIALENQISAFLKGGEGDRHLSVADRLSNDLGGTPYRLIAPHLQTRKYTGCDRLGSALVSLSAQKKTRKNCAIVYQPRDGVAAFNPNYLVTGPYVALSPGTYEVTVNYAIAGEQGRDGAAVGRLEIASHEPALEILDTAPLPATSNKMIAHKVRFRLRRMHANIELRLFLTRNVAAKVEKIHLVQLRAARDDVREIPFKGQNARRLNPRFWVSKETPPVDGYYAIFGALDFDETLHGLLFLNTRGEVVHTMPLDHRLISAALDKLGTGKKRPFTPPSNNFPHGLAVLADGSVVIHDGDSGNMVARLDQCGQPQWIKAVPGHHAIAVEGDTFWHFAPDFTQRRISDGTVLREFTWEKIALRNPELGGINLRRLLGQGRDLSDPVHLNDVEPLPARLAAAFPQFAAGDLLVSARSLDLVVVIDPKTLRVKWWRNGPWVRQHDPDWLPDGTISVYDNQMRDGHSIGRSRIIGIDPATFQTKTLFDGGPVQAYSAIRGKHQILSDGSLLITLSQQGRVLHVTRDGRVMMEFLNRFDERRNLLLSEAQFFASDFFDFDFKELNCAPS